MNKIKVNTLQLKRSYTLNALTAALDEIVEAAVDLGISENELIARLQQRLHGKDHSNVIPVNIQQQRKLYNPEAGP